MFVIGRVTAFAARQRRQVPMIVTAPAPPPYASPLAPPPGSARN